MGWVVAVLLLFLGCPTPPAAPSAGLREQLAALPSVQDEMLGGLPVQGTFTCALDHLGAQGPRLFLWLQCEDRGGESAGTGSALPAVVVLGDDGVVDHVRFPRQPSLEADLAAMFPPAVLGRIQRREFDPCLAVPPHVADPALELRQVAGRDVLGLLGATRVSATTTGRVGPIRLMLVGDEGVGQVAAAFEHLGCAYTVWLRAGTTLAEAEEYLATAY